MKKNAIHTIVALITILWGMNMSAQDGLRPRGDVNGDWEVTIADVNMLVDGVSRGIEYHPFYTYACDINGDREINIADINLLIDALLGTELRPMPSYSGTLPVLYINTEGGRDIVGKQKEDYLHADWWLDAMGIEGYESIGSHDAPLGLLIKGRGNYTWENYNKKPFTIKLDQKCSMLGMPSNRHWVLLCNMEYWMGDLNDAIPFEIGRRLGMEWAPRQEPVEVVLNGQYIGLYFLTEKIRINKHRINVTEQENNETNPDLITGGWLLEIDNYYASNQINLVEGNGSALWITPHSPDTLSAVQREYITAFLTAADATIYNPDKESQDWERYINLDSLAIYYVVEEIVDNPESFSGSCYMHKERGEDTKLVFGPHWDGGSCYVRHAANFHGDHFIYDEVPSGLHQHWIGEIAKYPRFQARVRQLWATFYRDIYPSIDDYAYSLTARIEQAGVYDNLRWRHYSGDYVSITFRYNRYFRRYFHMKVAWLNSQWGVDTIEIPESQEPVPDPNSYQQNDDGCSNRNTQESSRGHGAHPRGKQR